MRSEDSAKAEDLQGQEQLWQEKDLVYDVANVKARASTPLEKLLAEEGGRPHWGKYYDEERYNWREIYPQWDAFRALRSQLDPQGRLGNDYITPLFD